MSTLSPSQHIQEITILLYQLRIETIREAHGKPNLTATAIELHEQIMKHALALSRAPSEVDVRTFEEFLDQHRNSSVSEVFHQLVAQFKKDTA